MSSMMNNGDVLFNILAPKYEKETVTT